MILTDFRLLWCHVTAMRAISLAVHVALATAASGAKPRAGCTARASWPDGREEERECIVEGVDQPKPSRASSSKPDVSSEFSWLKDTRWLWNNWREVVFRSDGTFLAPAENCEREGNPACRWHSDDDRIYVSFGGAGLHTLQANEDRTSIFGSRDSDGDEVTATREG